MTEILIQRPVADDVSAQQELLREFRHRLAELYRQALWLDMPFVAHFIGVAELSASEAEPDQLPHHNIPAKRSRGNGGESRP